MTRAFDEDCLSPAAVVDPYGYFASIRRDDPVHWNDRFRAWFVTRYSDCIDAFKDRRLSSARMSPLLEMDEAYAVLVRWMVFTDPPDHTRLRRVANAAFSPALISSIRGRIRDLVRELLDAMEARPDPDLIRDFTAPLPTLVMAELLGAPVEWRERIRVLSDDVQAMIFVELGDEEDHFARGRRGLLGLRDLVARLMERYRDTVADNLTSALMHSHESDPLSHDDLTSMLVLFLFGGHVNTTHLIANALLALMRHPGAAARLRADPRLVVAAVEELVRYDGPSKVTARVACEALELGGRRIRPGERVFLVQCSANRDPKRFAGADRLWLDRPDNKHLGFGLGIHYCIGAALARIESQIAIRDAVHRFPGMRPSGELRWRPNLLGRALEALPVVLD